MHRKIPVIFLLVSSLILIGCQSLTNAREYQSSKGYKARCVELRRAQSLASRTGMPQPTALDFDTEPGDGVPDGVPDPVCDEANW